MSLFCSMVLDDHPTRAICHRWLPPPPEFSRKCNQWWLMSFFFWILWL